MSSDWPEPRGFIMALVLSIMFLIISACADVEPTVDPSMSMHAEDEAIAKLRTSAEGGNASAQNQLGLLYYEGTGVPQDYRQAKQWFEEAAKQGHTGAQTNLGTLYLNGEGLRKATGWPCSGLIRRQSKEMLWLVPDLG